MLRLGTSTQEGLHSQFKIIYTMNTFVKVRIKLSILFLLMGGLLFAQEEEEATGITFSGSVDTYFRANLNASNDPDEGGTLAPGTSFANQPGFSLGMFNLISSYEGSKVGFTADLVFGPRGGDAVFGSAVPTGQGVAANASTFVNQLYAYWNVSDAVTLTLGNFNTFLGYEVISPTANFNYSTSYMFSYGPFSHTGIKVDVDLGSGFSFMGAVLNPTDATEFNPSNSYLGGAQLGYSNDAGGAWLNFLFDEDFFQVDLTAGWDVAETVYLGLNGTTATDNFFGAAVYLQNSFSDDFKLGVRGEYFSDKGVGVLTLDENVIDLTLSANYSVGSLTIIPEFRVDVYSEDNFVITDAPAGDASSSLSSFLLAAVYAF